MVGKMKEMKEMNGMKWFEFSQNNSGGVFIGHEYVSVQANDANEANEIAQEHGVYFDGCATGQDCSCCGDRWHAQWSDCDEGTDVPSLYGKEIDPDNIVYDGYQSSDGDCVLIVPKEN